MQNILEGEDVKHSSDPKSFNPGRDVNSSQWKLGVGASRDGHPVKRRGSITGSGGYRGRLKECSGEDHADHYSQQQKPRMRSVSDALGQYSPGSSRHEEEIV
jgi:hypothetical protein